MSFIFFIYVAMEQIVAFVFHTQNLNYNLLPQVIKNMRVNRCCLFELHIS